MTSQREVIDAFLNGENEPRRASNFRMEIAPDGYLAYLIGDGRVVFGKREPLRRFEIYDGTVPFGYDMPVTKANRFYHINRNSLNSQRHRVSRRVRFFDELPHGGTIQFHNDEPPPKVNRIDENFGIFEDLEPSEPEVIEI